MSERPRDPNLPDPQGPVSVTFDGVWTATLADELMGHRIFMRDGPKNGDVALSVRARDPHEAILRTKARFAAAGLRVVRIDCSEQPMP